MRLRKNPGDTPARSRGGEVVCEPASPASGLVRSYTVTTEGNVANLKAEEVQTPDGEKIIVIGAPGTVAPTAKTLKRDGFDRFRRLHSAEAAPGPRGKSARTA